MRTESMLKEWKLLNPIKKIPSQCFMSHRKSDSSSTKGQAAVKIVETLDHLSVAAVYIREVAKKFSMIQE